MGFLLFGKFERSHSQASLDLRIHEAMSVDCEQHSNSASGDNPKVRRLVVVYFYCFVWSNFGSQMTPSHEYAYETQILGHHGLHH